MTFRKPSAFPSGHGSDGVAGRSSLRLVLTLVFLALASAAGAQAFSSAIPPVLTLDQDRLFNQSAYGRRVVAEIQNRSDELAAENRRIEQELTAEEQTLTDQRPSLDGAEFRELADAFDAKVERIRREQAQKAVDLNVWIEDQQKRFFDTVFPVLTNLTEELGASIIIDRRFAMIALDRTDVTNLAILKVDQVLGDGSEPKE
jgi:Skp family chaperone for outer membrane proteins